MLAELPNPAPATTARSGCGAARLSVIIPTFNRANVLCECLDALARQSCGDAFEVIVADDGSTDDTRDVVDREVRRARASVRYFRQPNSGANAARNRAIAAAAGEILLFINDDVIPAFETMLAEHLAGHDEFPDDRVAILGRVTVSPRLPHSRLARLHLDRAFENLGMRTEHDWRAFFTCNVSVKRSLLQRGGTFEERIRYHEDIELSQRLSRLGLRVVYRPAALGYHEHYLAEDEFFRIAAREAKALATWSQIAPPELVATLGSLGFEPELPAATRLRHRIGGLVMGGPAAPIWKAIARRCPEKMGCAIYSRLYRTVMRAELRKELGRGEVT